MDDRLSKQASPKGLFRLQLEEPLRKRESKRTPDTEFVLCTGWLMDGEQRIFNRQSIPDVELGAKLDLKLVELPGPTFRGSRGEQVRPNASRLAVFSGRRQLAYAWPVSIDAVVNLLKAGKKLTVEVSTIKNREVVYGLDKEKNVFLTWTAVIVEVGFLMEG